MKADESANCAGRWEGSLFTGLFFYFFWGLEIVKCIAFLKGVIQFGVVMAFYFCFWCGHLLLVWSFGVVLVWS
jgi:hypothetical protein